MIINMNSHILNNPLDTTSNLSPILLSPILHKIQMGGKEVYPLVDGGKGIGFTNGTSAGLWAQKGGIGTFSAAAADYYDEKGNIILYSFKHSNRIDKHEELIAQEIKGAVTQARKAAELSNGNGLVNINILWDMGGSKRILQGMLEQASDCINGITAGAGIPYELGAIAAKYNVGFLPIVSSARVTQILWARAYKEYAANLQAIVYEDPWKAGGHNGLSNKEDPKSPEEPLERVLSIRRFMNSVGLDHIPIIIAGNVWHLSQWQSYIDHPEIGPLGFQLGTRTLVTQENPSQLAMKQAFLSAGEKNIPVHLHNFSPTGMYSSALENDFLRKLQGRLNREVKYSREETEELSHKFEIGARSRAIYVTEVDAANVQKWLNQGYTAGLPTPDQTMIFVDEEEAAGILKDQRECKGCLKGCKFSGWYEEPVNNHSTGIAPDPRSFCIFNTLYGASHGHDVQQELMFAGHTVYRFSSDPFYKDTHGNYKIPTISDLFDRVLTGY